MKLDIRWLFAVDRSALLTGVRITMSAIVPLIVGHQLGQSSFALTAALGGLFVAVSDTDGFFRVQILSLIATTVGIIVAAFLGTIVGGTIWGAILLTLVTALAVGFAGAFGNTASRASFPVLIALMIMLGRPGNVSSALARCEVMLIGACWAIALSLLFALVQTRPWEKNAVVAYSYFPNYFGRFYLFLTPFILLLFDISYPGDWQAAFIRILDTLIGGVLAYLAYALLWPRGTRVHVSDQLADLILANRDYLHRVVTNALEQHVDAKPLYQASEHVKSKYAAFVDAYQQLQTEPEGQRGNLAHVGKMMSYNQFFYDCVTVLASKLSRLSDRSCITDLQQVTQEVEKLLTEVADAVRGEHRLPQPVQQCESIQHLQAAIARLQPDQPAGDAKNQHETRPLEGKGCQAAVYTYFKSLIDAVIGMYTEQVEL